MGVVPEQDSRGSILCLSEKSQETGWAGGGAVSEGSLVENRV